MKDLDPNPFRAEQTQRRQRSRILALLVSAHGAWAAKPAGPVVERIPETIPLFAPSSIPERWEGGR